jgi:cullin-4
MEIVNAPDEESLAMMVEELLTFKSKLDELLAVAFDSSPTFTHTLKESCEAFINVRQNKPAELIAKYIDAMLKTGNKGTTEEDVELKLERLLVLFRYVNGKDVFVRCYFPFSLEAVWMIQSGPI